MYIAPSRLYPSRKQAITDDDDDDGTHLRKPRVLSPLFSYAFAHVWKEVDLIPLAWEDGSY